MPVDAAIVQRQGPGTFSLAKWCFLAPFCRRAWIMVNRSDPDGYYSSQLEMPEAMRERMEQIAFQYGQTYDSYLVTERDREYFWSRDRAGFVGFYRRRKRVIVTGGMMASPEDRESLLAEFLAFARRHRWSIAFFNVPRSQTAFFRKHGFQITKCGEEPIIKLSTTDWIGRTYEWIRRQENYCKRQGVEFCELRADPTDEDYRERIVPELEEISRQHLSQTLHRRELQFFVGQFRPLELGRRRLFVAKQGSQILAFIVCTPGLEGAFWAVETYRHRPESTRGVIPFAMLQTMRQMKQEGVDYVSLSLMPCLRCETAVIGDSGIMRWGLGFIWKRLNWIFDMRGTYHFKSRFRPYFREMYIAASPRLTLRSSVELLFAWRLLDFNPIHLCVHLYHESRNISARRTLATPPWRPERVIRDLCPSRTPFKSSMPPSAEACAVDSAAKETATDESTTSS
jgi:phosphatidylglycerol lysyltransferase